MWQKSYYIDKKLLPKFVYMNEVIELDPVIDVELVIGILHQYWIVFLSGYLLLFFLPGKDQLDYQSLCKCFSTFLFIPALNTQPYKYNRKKSFHSTSTKFYTNERQLERESNFLCKSLLSSLFRLSSVQTVGKRPNGC